VGIVSDRPASPERVPSVRPTARQRSAVTNGSRLFVDGDGNSGDRPGECRSENLTPKPCCIGLKFANVNF
jgi:hypothetical protein